MPQHAGSNMASLSALYTYTLFAIGGQLHAIPTTLVSWCAYHLMCKIVPLNFVSARVAAQYQPKHLLELTMPSICLAKARVSIPKETFWLENQHENQLEIPI